MLMIYSREAVAFFRWLRELFEVCTWKEYWMVVSIPASIAGFWFIFSVFLSIQNVVLRAAAIWSLILTLLLGGATVESLMKQRK